MPSGACPSSTVIGRTSRSFTCQSAIVATLLPSILGHATCPLTVTAGVREVWTVLFTRQLTTIPNSGYSWRRNPPMYSLSLRDTLTVFRVSVEPEWWATTIRHWSGPFWSIFWPPLEVAHHAAPLCALPCASTIFGIDWPMRSHGRDLFMVTMTRAMPEQSRPSDVTVLTDSVHPSNGNNFWNKFYDLFKFFVFFLILNLPVFKKRRTSGLRVMTGSQKQVDSKQQEQFFMYPKFDPNRITCL